MRGAALGLRHLHQLERIGDIVEGAHPGKQRLAIVLEHVAELDVRERLAVEQDLARIGRNEPGDHVDQRALAAAVGPEHRDQFAARNVEIEVVVDDRLVETLAQAADGDVRRLPAPRRGAVAGTLAAMAGGALIALIAAVIGSSASERLADTCVTSTFSGTTPIVVAEIGELLKSPICLGVMSLAMT